MKNTFDSFSQIFEESYDKVGNSIINEKLLDQGPAEDYASQKQVDVKTGGGEKWNVKPWNKAHADEPKKQVKSELTSGGSIESTLIDIVAKLEDMTDFQFKITGGRDIFHKEFIGDKKSHHNTGYALDIVSPSLKDKANRKKLEEAFIKLMLDGTYDKNGLRLGAINEYDNPTGHSTGGHFHMSLTKDDLNKDGYECNLALSGIKSYADIRKMKKEGETTKDIVLSGEDIQKSDPAKTLDKTEDIKSEEGLISKGDKGEAVTAIQAKLVSLGYDLGTWGPNGDGIDGSYGSSTKKAIEQFQEKNGLSIDGVVGPETIGVLTKAKVETKKVSLSNGLTLEIFPSAGKVALAALVENVNVYHSFKDALLVESAIDAFSKVLKSVYEPFMKEWTAGKIKAAATNSPTEARFNITKNADENYVITALGPDAEASLGKKEAIIDGDEDKKKLDDATKIKHIVKKAKAKAAELTKEELDKLNSIDTKIEPLDSLPKLSRGAYVRKNIKIIEKALRAEGINNPYAIIAILGVIGKESGFNPVGENGYYSKERLPEVWGTFSKTGSRVKKGQGKNNYNDLAVAYEKNPEKLFDFTYRIAREKGSKYNHKPSRDRRYGNVDSGDGYKYRGGGFNQLTFRGSYKKIGDLVGINLMGGADGSAMTNPEIAASVMAKFMKSRFQSPKANLYGASDYNSFTSQDQADKAAAHANTGWGKSYPSGAIASTQKFTPHFSFKQEGEEETTQLT